MRYKYIISDLVFYTASRRRGSCLAQVTCGTEHLSLFALLFLPFLCSNAAAIFSSEGLEALGDAEWMARLPGLHGLAGTAAGPAVALGRPAL